MINGHLKNWQLICREKVSMATEKKKEGRNSPIPFVVIKTLLFEFFFSVKQFGLGHCSSNDKHDKVRKYSLKAQNIMQR